MRLINLGIGVASETALTVHFELADASTRLLISRGGDSAFAATGFIGPTARVPLPPGDFVVVVEGDAPPSPRAPLTIETDSDVVMLTAGRGAGRARSLITSQGRRAVVSDPASPWPPPAGNLRGPASGSGAGAPMLDTLCALADAFAAERDPAATAAPAIHALLVGIDGYAPGPGVDQAIYGNLRGCVGDILAVEEFLLHDVRVPPARITRLVSPVPGGPGSELVGTPASLPTYANIVAAWRRVTAAARPGDIVYIHYSGHGGRAATAFPAIKASRLDESLAPCDINDPAAGRYLRDVEIAALLRETSNRGLYTTLVLDSCHSGSATRGVEATRRQGSRDDLQPRGHDTADTSAVASRAELEAIAHMLETRPRYLDESWHVDQPDRSIHAGPAPVPHTIVTACRQHESAYEYPVDDSHHHGALTYFWLEALRTPGVQRTYRSVYRRAAERVRAVFPGQSPLLLGAADLPVFGTTQLPPPTAIAVTEVRGDRIQLAAGATSAIDPGTRLAVVPPDRLPELTELAGLTQIEVTEAHATRAYAEIVPGTGDAGVVAGAHAVVMTYAPRVRRGVRMLPPRGGSPATRSALAELATVIDQDPTHLLTTDATSADYQVTIDEMMQFEILDRGGSALPHLRPPIAITEPDAIRRVTARLIHLARYFNVRELTNDAPHAPLTGKLAIELRDRQRGPLSLDAPLIDGTHFDLRIANRSVRHLQIMVFNLTPGWSVVELTQGYPLTLDPDQSQDISLTAVLPPGYRRGTDVLKVIATLEVADLSLLALPRLDQPPASAVTRGDGRHPLERLAQRIRMPGVERDARYIPMATHGWTEARVSFEITRDRR